MSTPSIDPEGASEQLFEEGLVHAADQDPGQPLVESDVDGLRIDSPAGSHQERLAKMQAIMDDSTQQLLGARIPTPSSDFASTAIQARNQLRIGASWLPGDAKEALFASSKPDIAALYQQGGEVHSDKTRDGMRYDTLVNPAHTTLVPYTAGFADYRSAMDKAAGAAPIVAAEVTLDQAPTDQQQMVDLAMAGAAQQGGSLPDKGYDWHLDIDGRSALLVREDVLDEFPSMSGVIANQVHEYHMNAVDAQIGD